MKKTITGITILCFTILSFHFHGHELEHSIDMDHPYDYIEIEENCNFCKFNSDYFLIQNSKYSKVINFKNIIFKQYIVYYKSLNQLLTLNKSPPQ